MTAAGSLDDLTNSEGNLLDGLLGSLAGAPIDLDLSQQQLLSNTGLNVADLIDALQITVGSANVDATLNAQVTLQQLLSAAASAQTQASNPQAAVALNSLSQQVSGVSGKIKLSDLLSVDNRDQALDLSSIGTLDFVDGVLSAYSDQQTGAVHAVTIDGSDIGLPQLGVVQLSVVVTDAPKFSCGSVGTTSKTAGLRIRIHANLLNLNVPLMLAAPLASAKVALSALDLIVTVSPTTATVTSLDPSSGAADVQLNTPAVGLMVGTVSDAALADRDTPIVTTGAGNELFASTIGSLQATVLGSSITLAVHGRAAVSTAAGSQMTVHAVAPYPSTVSVSAGSNYLSNLVTSLLGNLTITVDAPDGGLLGPALNTINNTLIPTATNLLKTTGGTLGTTLSSVLNGVVAPVLGPLGVTLGQNSLQLQAAPHFPVGALCNDTRFCTENDACNNLGACIGLAKLCADALGCTSDSCSDTLSTCVHSVTDGCLIGGNTCVAENAVDPNNVCKSCRPLLSKTLFSNTATGGACSDGRFCTLVDSCDGNGSCIGTSNRPCDDTRSCTVDACDDNASACLHTLSAGCLISGLCVSDGDPNPSNSCQSCDVGQSASLWTAITGGSCTTDPDTDGDGLTDSYECMNGTSNCPDSDLDGLDDYKDPDDDGDGILTRFERPGGTSVDHDDDGKPDYLDTDDDADATLTKNEEPDRNGDGDPSDARDTNTDGTPDYLDPNYPDALPEASPDAGPADAGTPDAGRPDAAASGSGGSAAGSGGAGSGEGPDAALGDAGDDDPDGDGLRTRYERHGSDDQDSDSDGTPDHLDRDDDGDGVPTRDEDPDPNGDRNPSDARDSDRDGSPDYLDSDDDGDGIPTAREVGDGARYGDDVDMDGVPDWLDDDSDGDGLSDSVEGTDDNDEDGVPDYLSARTTDMDAAVSGSGSGGAGGSGRLGGRVSGGSHCSVAPGPGRARPDSFSWSLILAIGLLTWRRARRY